VRQVSSKVIAIERATIGKSVIKVLNLIALGQTQMALPFASGIVPEELEEVVLENLISEIELKGYHFDCGVFGLRKLIDLLIAYDCKDVLYKMIN